MNLNIEYGKFKKNPQNYFWSVNGCGKFVLLIMNYIINKKNYYKLHIIIQNSQLCPLLFNLSPIFSVICVSNKVFYILSPTLKMQAKCTV